MLQPRVVVVSIMENISDMARGIIPSIYSEIG